MLVENEDVISFQPGSQINGRTVLGRIIVHDRVTVEANVLPRYFNHSSFASLRRQLNYFSFVRLGKGRQRESSYTNERVVVLDDILHLKRRPNTGKSRASKKSAAAAAAAPETKEHRPPAGLTTEVDDFDDNGTTQSNAMVSVASSSTAPPVLNVSHPSAGRLPRQRVNGRRRRHQTASNKGVVFSGSAATAAATISPRSLSPLENGFLGEDEQHLHCESKQYIALDLTKPDLSAGADVDVLEGCKDLLHLASGKVWD